MSTTSFLPARLDSTWVLVDAPGVLEVVGTVPWLRLPRAHRAIPGVIAWRARAVPVVDLAAFLPGVEHGQPRSRTLIVRTAQSTVAVPVDAVTEVVHVPREMMRVPHAVRTDVATAETELHGQLMAVVDLSALVGRLTGEDANVRGNDAVA